MTKKLNFPTILTIVRTGLSLAFLVLMICGINICDWDTRHSGYDTIDPCDAKRILFFITALIIFIVAAITDKIDGDYARKHNQVTDLGKFLDPLADKMLVNSAFLALTVMDIVPVWVFALILWRDFAVDGMRMMIARNGETAAASIWGKCKTTAQMLALVVLMLNLIIPNGILATAGTVLLYLALVLTIYSGIDYTVKGWPKAIK